MGGAIFNQGTLALTQVTIEGNEAEGGDSAVAGLGIGGGGIGEDATGGRAAASAGRVRSTADMAAQPAAPSPPTTAAAARGSDWPRARMRPTAPSRQRQGW